MPIEQDKIENFQQIFQRFDPNGTHKIAKADFNNFVNSFTNLGKAPQVDEEEEEANESDSEVQQMTFIGADSYDMKTTNYLWKSFDIKNEGTISEELCKYCMKGLSGYFQDFTLKLYFRVLDTKHIGYVSNNELRQMKYLMNMNLSEDEMIKRFEKQLGHEIDEINYQDFFFCFKHRKTDEQSAYDPDIFGVRIGFNDDENDGGCCLII